MIKYLLVLGVVGLVLWLLLRTRGAIGPRKPDAAGNPAATARREAMVACAHCGVHLPLSEAVADGTHVYCGEPHRLAGPTRRGD
jgi:uncharacterized protein